MKIDWDLFACGLYDCMNITQANHSSPAFAMEIDGGSGGGTLATTATATIATSMGWQMHKVFATLPWEGAATFRLRVFGSVSLQVGVVAIAPIGEAWLKSDDDEAAAASRVAAQ